VLSVSPFHPSRLWISRSRPLWCHLAVYRGSSTSPATLAL
jgi:hypothetical protein